MILPRRLMTYTDKSGRIRFCEADDVRQQMNYRPKGFMVPDAEAERIGLKAYLDETGYGEVAHPSAPAEPEAEAKAVAQAEVEDKAVSGPAAKGLIIEPASKDPEPNAPEPKDPESTHESHDDPKDDAKDNPGPGLHIDPAQRRGPGRR